MKGPSRQLIDQLLTLQQDPEVYAGERGGLVDDTFVLALHEGFDDLALLLHEAEDGEDIRDALAAWPVNLAIHMTYERISWVSDEDEEPERDIGFYEPGGWYYSITDEDFQKRVAEIGQQAAVEEMSPEPARFRRLDEAFEYVSGRGTLEPSSSPGWHPGLWYTTSERDWDSYGNEVRYSFHVEGSATDEKKFFDALGDRGVLS